MYLLIDLVIFELSVYLSIRPMLVKLSNLSSIYPSSLLTCLCLGTESEQAIYVSIHLVC